MFCKWSDIYSANKQCPVTDVGNKRTNTLFFHLLIKIRNSSVAESDCSKYRWSSFHSVQQSQYAIKNKKGTHGRCRSLFIYFYRIHDDIHLVTPFRAANQALSMSRIHITLWIPRQRTENVYYVFKAIAR